MGAVRLEHLNWTASSQRESLLFTQERGDQRLREYRRVPIGNDGVVLQRGAPQAYPLIDAYFDVDDTFLQSSKVKKTRQKEYENALTKAGISIPNATATRVMEATYAIAQEQVGNGSYLTNNHTRLLALITDHMAATPEGQEREAVVNQMLTRLETEGIQDTDQLRIRDGVLELTYHSSALPALEEMFERTLLETEEFRQTVDAFAHLCTLRDRGVPIRLNLLTLGYPPEQEVKISGLFGRNQGVKPDRILITRVPKDEFMGKVRGNSAYNALPLTYPDGEVRTSDALEPYPHVVLGVDDSIKSLNSQANMTSLLAEIGAQVALVRIRRNTKDGDTDWGEKGDHLEIDLRERTMDGVELAEALVDRGMSYLHKTWIPAQRTVPSLKLAS